MTDQDGIEEERPESQGDDAEMMARLREEIENLPVSEHVVYMLHSLSTLAIGRLGLTADTVARRDLGQARLAIDAFKALLAVLEPVLPAGEVSAHRGVLSQLQLAYAGVSDRDDSVQPVQQRETRTTDEVQTAGEATTDGREADGPKETAAAPKKKTAAPKKTTAAPKKTTAAPKKTAKPRKTS